MGESIALNIPYALFTIVVAFPSEPVRKLVDRDAVSVFADDQAESVVGFGRASAFGAVGEVDALFAREVICCLSPGDAVLNKADSAFSAELSPFICSLDTMVRTHGSFLRFGFQFVVTFAGSLETWPSFPRKHRVARSEIQR